MAETPLARFARLFVQPGDGPIQPTPMRPPKERAILLGQRLVVLPFSLTLGSYIASFLEPKFLRITVFAVALLVDFIFCDIRDGIKRTSKPRS